MLRIEQLRKSFGSTEVLRGIDLVVEPGQVVCLIGASGSGKSTLLRCIDLLETVDDGTVWLADDAGSEQDITDPRVDIDAIRRRIGIVFQAYNLFPHLSVLQNLVLAPTKAAGVSRADARTRALALLDRVGLADKASAYPDSLSGGQQQRVALARALAMDPEVLLLDEITSALDPLLVGEVLDVVRGLRADGIAVVMATHEMSFAREASDVVAFLADGEIVEIGPPEQLFEAPQDPRTAAFLARFRA
ncbi:MULTISPECIES: amino acid ABC transporter ATP-binding protein [unclassified Aeromicrobium]|uniref:amino acid ABC transporter ATP-binding protein n=1 Tax=unclassified Aeromicrobium TaxID=2633570 RepID=UPI0006F69B86|nr:MULTISPECIES: amino acid ABC transporter ATP-binding protein [unclassified Aeromicrobium]KQP78126.1 peptide ABC transporter ATP-binding protein [Aeromicrobium sp. Leaf289]KQP83834.1 peptide ABC transporter ATP-binding protein [Aeromicrobium sp. Leaf291]